MFNKINVRTQKRLFTTVKSDNTVTDLDIISIDLVQNPVHKYAVAFLSDDKGVQYDHYDYGLLKGLMTYWKHPFQSCNYKRDKIKRK